MTGREAWLSAGLVFAVAVVVRAVFAVTLAFPTPEDTAYYVTVARNLVTGHGLVSDAIWSYQTPPLEFPRPAFEVWLPLPSLLAAGAMSVLGPTFAAAKAWAILVGSVVPVLAWRLAADVGNELALPVGRRRTLAIGTGLTAAVELPLVLFGAQPDSTMLFAAFVLGACLLMTRLVRTAAGPAGARARPWRDPHLLALGLLIGLAALTRNEAIWIGLTWAVVAWRWGPPGRRLGLVAVPAVVALLVFTPWALRDWTVFGTPLPGQALANALSVTGFDIFAWKDPPTLARYLALGPARLLELRLDGLAHDLIDVLIVPGFPIALVGIVALPWLGRARALRPLVAIALITFLVTSLVFPVATTWGTFLHAAGAVHVLLIVVCLLAFDRLIAQVGRRRGWTNPVAWFGPALTLAAGLLFSIALSGYGSQAADVSHRYQVLARQMAAAGHPLDGTAGPIVTDFPIWLAEALPVETLALPNEPPADVVDLAQRFSARYLMLTSSDRGIWPGVLASGAPDAACFRPVVLPASDQADAALMANVRVFEIGCP